MPIVLNDTIVGYADTVMRISRIGGAEGYVVYSREIKKQKIEVPNSSDGGEALEFTITRKGLAAATFYLWEYDWHLHARGIGTLKGKVDGPNKDFNIDLGPPEGIAKLMCHGGEWRPGFKMYEVQVLPKQSA